MSRPRRDGSCAVVASLLTRVRRRLVRLAAERLVPTTILTVRGPANRPRVALTFDDGPLPLTTRYLKELERHQVRATFFLIGGECRRRPDDAREIVERGHEVANHGETHRSLPSLSRAEIVAELAETEALLPPAPDDPLGQRRPLVRPPHGATSLRSLAVCALSGYRTVLWSLDSGDARDRDPRDLARNVSAPRVRPGEIVLLHEGQQWTLDALPRIIDQLRGAGFELCTVGELLAA